MLDSQKLCVYVDWVFPSPEGPLTVSTDIALLPQVVRDLVAMASRFGVTHVPGDWLPLGYRPANFVDVRVLCDTIAIDSEGIMCCTLTFEVLGKDFPIPQT